MERVDLFQFSVENAQEIIFIFNDSGIITYANQAAIKQLEYPEGLCGISVEKVFLSGFQTDPDIMIMDMENTREIQEVMVYRKNRTCFPAKVQLLICEEAEGKRTYMCTAWDISTRRFWEKQAGRAEEEADDAQKVKTEFVANVTHELRTPVNGISGNARELIDLETDKDKLKRLHMIERGCKDMNALINNILDFSKLEAGKFVLELRKFNFRNMFDYIKGNHSGRIIEKGLNFSFTISPEIPENIIGDELRIVQVLNNLISNAYKFTSVGSIHVEAVKTAQSGNKVELFFMVMDTGIGIAKADQDKLFKSFSQVDASISRKYGGTGLGLNICKQLVELMGGNIHVESEVGKGSVFSFYIWVEIPEDELAGYEGGDYARNEDEILLSKLQGLNVVNGSDKVKQYGTLENKSEIEKKMSKLILSVEMENWDKAEMFAESIKELVEDAPREVKSAALRMKMAVQKGDYEKSMTAYENLQKAMEEPC